MIIMVYYKKIQGKINSPEVVVLHGFGCHKYISLDWGKWYNRKGYTVHGLTANGHGNQPGKFFSWAASVRKFAKYINNLHKEVVVIGHSMGGTQVFALTQLRNVKQVFAIGGLHDEKEFYEISIVNLIRSIRKKIVRDLKGKRLDIEQVNRLMRYVKNILPVNLKLTNHQQKKIHLIHQLVDPVVPYYHYKKNKKKFHVSDNRCLTLYQIGHISPPNQIRVRRFILDKIEKL